MIAGVGVGVYRAIKRGCWWLLSSWGGVDTSEYVAPYTCGDLSGLRLVRRKACG